MSARTIMVAASTVPGVSLLGACSGSGGAGHDPAPVSVPKQAEVASSNTVRSSSRA